jgi:decaprenylphospho-beta-D-ribofuranose 2-oxidase
MSYVYRPATVTGIREVMETARSSGRSVGVRGTGLGLTDAALNAENVSVELSRMDGVLFWDPSSGRVEVEPGVTVGHLWRHVIEDGWWPPVVPESMHKTLGGSAALDAHGKNHWKAGSIADHIEGIDLLLPDGSCLPCSPVENEELFRAALGGFGLIGVVVRLRLQMKPVSSGLLRVRTLRSRNLSDTFAMFEAWTGRADYVRGWIDGCATGPALGRGVVHIATHVDDDQNPVQTLRTDFQDLSSLVGGVLPRSQLWRVLRLLTRPGARFLNEAGYRALGYFPGGERLTPLAKFLFAQDQAPGWQRAFRPGGVIDYQPFLPETMARPVFHALLKRTHAQGQFPCLTIIGRHRASKSLLSRSMDGYSLSLHFPITAANQKTLARTLDRLTEEVVVPAGGRVLPASGLVGSDQTAAQAFGAESVDRFVALKRAYDPDEVLQSDMYRRLFPHA